MDPIPLHFKPRKAERERHEFGKLQQRLRRQVGRAIADFNLIEAGDRVMVCLSGGKDSYSMLEILLALRKKAPIDFDLNCPIEVVGVIASVAKVAVAAKDVGSDTKLVGVGG